MTFFCSLCNETLTKRKGEIKISILETEIASSQRNYAKIARKKITELRQKLRLESTRKSTTIYDKIYAKSTTTNLRQNLRENQIVQKK